MQHGAGLAAPRDGDAAAAEDDDVRDDESVTTTSTDSDGGAAARLKAARKAAAAAEAEAARSLGKRAAAPLPGDAPTAAVAPPSSTDALGPECPSALAKV